MYTCMYIWFFSQNQDLMSSAEKHLEVGSVLQHLGHKLAVPMEQLTNTAVANQPI